LPEIFDQGYLALPPTENRAPAVMVLPAWWGLNSFFKQFCDRLAQAGFVAFAPDLYGGKVAETIEQATALRDGLDDEKTNNLLRSAIPTLRQHPRANSEPIGAIGFSLGVFYALALLADIPDQIGALVLFYGMGADKYPTLKTPVLGHFAENDEYEEKDYIDYIEKTLKAAGADTTFYTYPGTGHWFFEANQPKAYKAEAAQLAWERTVSFLKEHLK
jgi:carboxymethylenebutenolidase